MKTKVTLDPDNYFDNETESEQNLFLCKLYESLRLSTKKLQSEKIYETFKNTLCNKCVDGIKESDGYSGCESYPVINKLICPHCGSFQEKYYEGEGYGYTRLQDEDTYEWKCESCNKVFLSRLLVTKAYISCKGGCVHHI